MTRITAAVAHAFGAPLSVEPVDLRPPGPGEVEVRIEAVAICHSDITYADGHWGGTLPAAYGHEAAGRITATAPGSPWNIGEKVIATLIRACGTCPCCSTGAPYHCEAPAQPGSPLTALDGAPIHQGLNTAAFAERIVVHESQLAAVPQDMPSDAASLLACGVITGVGAVVNAARLRTGQDAVVIGAGGVGLNAIQGARLAGARRIVAIDLNPEKLNDAKAFGATDTLTSGPETAAQLREILPRGAHAVFVCTGALPAFDTAPKLLATGGKLVAVGMPPSGAMARYEPVSLAYYGQSLMGSKMGNTVLSRDIPWLCDLWRQGRLQLEPLVSRRWSLDQINEAIADTRAGGARRNVIVFD